MWKRLIPVLCIGLLMSCASAEAIRNIGSLDGKKASFTADGKARSVDIVAFNDFHGTVYEDPLGKNVGMAKAVSYVRRLEALNPNLLLLSGGDNYQGSALSVMSKGAIVSDFFRSIGVSGSAVGNHEFDWGDSWFESWKRDGGFPFLAANILDRRTGKTPAWAKPYQLYRVGGRLIAVIGLSTRDTVNSARASFIENYEFTDAAEAAQRWSIFVRANYHPDFVVALTHIPTAMDGLDATRAISANQADELTALAKRGKVDAIITAHSHNYVNGTCEGVPVIQASYNGRAFGVLHLTFAEDGTWKLRTEIQEFWKEKAELREDGAFRTTVDGYMAKYGSDLLKKVAVLEADLPHDRVLTPNVTPLGAWVCSAMAKRYGADIAIQNGGGLRKPLAAGSLTVQDFWELMPFDNTAVVFEAKGSDIRRMIDHGIDSIDFANGQFWGFTVTYNPSKPYGAKIVSMKDSKGNPVEDEKVYKVVTNDFVFEGGDAYSMIKGAAVNAVNTFEPIRDMLIDEAAKAGRIAKPDTGFLVSVAQ